jgi:hypothetical protein
VSYLFYLARKLGGIYNFRYMANCHRERLMKIRNNIGAYESVRKLVAFSSDVIVDIHHRRLWSVPSDIAPIGLMCASLMHRLSAG